MRKALLLLSILTSLVGQAQVQPFRAKVHWKPWETKTDWRHPILGTDGNETYRVTLVPLWALEGGIVAIEITLSHPETPDKNLLGERENGVEQPFVVTVEQLENGIRKSKFGARRVFSLPKPEQGRLEVDIRGWKRGLGVGDCRDCPNIQRLDAVVSVQQK